MHKLSRPNPEPEALSHARKRFSTWGDKRFTVSKPLVVENLIRMQEGRCAYCECSLDGEHGHIEHFRKQSLFPNLVFSWDNLFFSCMSEAHCGKKKDKVIGKKEDNQKLIDPCQDNPEDFFIFTYDGKIMPRTDLSETERSRAEFTIDTFSLNDSTLMQARRNVMQQFEWLKEYPNSIDDYLINALPKGQPYITAIYHYFGKRVV